MSMSRKHYNVIAEALHTTGASVSTAAELANRFREDNARFDILRFMEASCGSTWNAGGTWRIAGGFCGPEYLTRDMHKTATFTCRDIGYGVETGEVILPALSDPDYTGKRSYQLVEGGVVYLFDDELDDVA